jgi:hypothetical protein
MKKITLIIALLTLSIAFTNCKKYEDGPSFTLLTKKMRISGNWKLTTLTVNGTGSSINGLESKLDINKEGSYTATSTFGSISFSETGKWAFSSDKKQLTLTPSTASSIPSTFDILELKNTEMKLKQIKNNNTEISTYNQ